MRVVVKIAELKTVPFFPQHVDAWALIVGSMSNYISDDDELVAFTEAYLEYAKKYEGLAGMREIYFAHVRASAPGSGSDLEARYLMREIEENELRMAMYKSQRLLGAPKNEEPVLLPQAKTSDQQLTASSQQGSPLASSRLFRKIQDALTDCSVRPPTLSLKEREEQLAQSVKVTRVRSHRERLQSVQEIRTAIGVSS